MSFYKEASLKVLNRLLRWFWVMVEKNSIEVRTDQAKEFRLISLTAAGGAFAALWREQSALALFLSAMIWILFQAVAVWVRYGDMRNGEQSDV
jgi:hypothetical protein